MQTGGCAGFGKTPNARARRLLSRVLWAGGLAVAGSVVCAAAANAAEPDQTTEPAGGLLSSLTPAVEPLSNLVEPVAGELELTEDLLSAHSLLAPAQLADFAEQPLAAVSNAVGVDTNAATAADEASRTTERDAAADVTDRSFDRSRADVRSHDEAAEDAAGAHPEGGATPALDLTHLLGSVDPLLGSVERLAPERPGTGGQLTDKLLGEQPSAPPEAALPVFSTLETADPLGAVTGVVSLLNPDYSGGLHMLDPITSVLAPLESIVRAAGPFASDIDPLQGVAAVAGLLDPAWQEPSHGASVTPLALTDSSPMSAVAAPGSSVHDSRDALPADVADSEPAVIHSSRDASQDDQSSPADSRGDLRPSLLMTPVAGITLHAGATGTALSADQAGPSSHALLPEQAVLRARLFSAAAYARGADVKPLREANDPPVSPD
jgi:hypothetical protein